jgi:hypothetical protein
MTVCTSKIFRCLLGLPVQALTSHSRRPIRGRHIMRESISVLCGLAVLPLVGNPAVAQREYHRNDGPYHGLTCEPDETVVPILGGVKCQKMPDCGPDQTMASGPNGFECRQIEHPAPVQADAPTGVIPAIHATVVGLRFFESPAQLTSRNYDDIFFYNAARYIYWELHLVHPDPGQRTSFTLEEIWHSPGGDVAYQATRTFTIDPGWTSSTFWANARLVGTKTVETQNPLYYDCLNRRRRQSERGGLPESCSATTGVDIEQWQRGAYQVNILVDHQRVATGWFAMLEKDNIYGEVGAKTRDRSSPAGAVAALDAKVVSLRFFEAGSEAPPRERRSYATEFSRASARNIVWELDLMHPAPHLWLPLPIEALLYFQDAGGERIVQRKVLQSAAPADWRDTYHMDYFGWENDYYYGRAGSTSPSPRRWLPGMYRVDLYVLNRKVASESFEMR